MPTSRAVRIRLIINQADPLKESATDGIPGGARKGHQRASGGQGRLTLIDSVQNDVFRSGRSEGTTAEVVV